MRSQPTTRRRLLQGVGAGLGVALAGCTALRDVRYSLHSRPRDGTDPVDLFTWRPASNAFHYDEDYVETLADELRETGTVESIEIPLVERRGTAEEGYRPSFTRQDGTYHRVRVRSEPVSLDRWVVWMEPLEELPEGVDATDDPTAGLSALDVEIVERAATEAVGSAISDRDHAAQRAYDRGVVFFDPLDPAESDLVPEPPFEYAVIEPDTHLRRQDLPVRLHVEEEAIETTRYVHELELVASSREELVAHVEAQHVAVQYDSNQIDEATREILIESTSLTGYVEEDELSEPFESVLDDLDVTDVEVPDGREVASWLRFYALDDAYYSASFRVSDDALIRLG